MVLITVDSFGRTTNLYVDPSVETQSPDSLSADATITIPVKTSDMRNIFNFSSDTSDTNDLANTDSRYYIDLESFPFNLSLNPAMCEVTSGSVDNYSTDLRYDYLRHLSVEIFTTARAVDLFHNESNLRANLESVSYDSWIQNYNILSEYSTKTATGSILQNVDGNGNYYSLSSDTLTKNVCYIVLKQLLSQAASRFTDLTQYYVDAKSSGDWHTWKVPFYDNDAIAYKLTVGQSTTTSITGTTISPRSYIVRLLCVADGSATNELTVDNKSYTFTAPYHKMAVAGVNYNLDYTLLSSYSSTSSVAMKNDSYTEVQNLLPTQFSNIPSQIMYLDGWYYRWDGTSSTDRTISIDLYNSNSSRHPNITLSQLRSLSLTVNLMQNIAPKVLIYTKPKNDGSDVSSGVYNQILTFEVNSSTMSNVIVNTTNGDTSNAESQKSKVGNYYIGFDSGQTGIPVSDSDYNLTNFTNNGSNGSPVQYTLSSGSVTGTDEIKTITIFKDLSEVQTGSSMQFVLQSAMYAADLGNSNYVGEILDFTKYDLPNVGASAIAGSNA